MSTGPSHGRHGRDSTLVCPPEGENRDPKQTKSDTAGGYDTSLTVVSRLLLLWLHGSGTARYAGDRLSPAGSLLQRCCVHVECDSSFDAVGAHFCRPMSPFDIRCYGTHAAWHELHQPHLSDLCGGGRPRISPQEGGTMTSPHPFPTHAVRASRLLRLSSYLDEGKEKGADEEMDAIPLPPMVLVELSH